MRRALILHLIFPLIVAFLTPFLTAISSQLVTGNWVIWLSAVPLFVWVIFFLVLSIWIIIAFVGKRLKKINDRGGIVIENPLADWYDVGEKQYNNIIWIIQSTNRQRPSKAGIRAVSPRCVKCKTPLEYKKGFFGKYIWKCMGCGFKTKTKDSMLVESERVERLARRDFEILEGN